MGFTTTPQTPGSGVDVAVDSVGGDLFERVKLVDGLAGGTDGIPGSAARGLEVDTHRRWSRIAVTPTISAASAYTAGDSIGGELALANAVRAAGEMAVVRAVMVTNKGTNSPGLELWFADRQLGSGATDNAALNPGTADLPFLTGRISISSWSTFSTNQVARSDFEECPIRCNSGTTAYLYPRVTGTPTFTTTSDLTIVLFVEHF